MAQVTAKRDRYMTISPGALRLLRDSAISEHDLAILESGAPMTVTGRVLDNLMLDAWRAGRYSARDHFVWHSVAELLGEPGA